MKKRPNKKDKRYNNVHNTKDMAKYKKKQIVSEEVESINTTTTKVEKDPLREQILALRAKGFDNNRIASLLAIHKQTVDKY